MWKFIEKLRNLPENSRKAVVLFSAAGITAVILISWLVFPVPHFGSLSVAEQERKDADNLTTPFSIIGGEIQNSFGGLKDKWISLGGSEALVSVVSALKENMATSTAPSTPEQNTLSDQESFLSDSAASSTDNAEAVTTSTTTKE